MVRTAFFRTLVAGLALTAPVHASVSNTPELVPGVTGMVSCNTCHNGAPSNASTGSATLTGIPASYVPGQRYPVTVTVELAGAKHFGFVVAATDGAGAQGGRVIVDDNQMDVRVENGVFYVKQSFNGLTDAQIVGKKSWTFLWQAPEAVSGTVSFQLNAVAGDGDWRVTGDASFAARSTTSPETTTAD